MTNKEAFRLTVVVFLIIAIISALLFPTHKIQVPVTDTYWIREHKIDNYEPRLGESWDEQVPSDAYNQTSYRKKRSESCVKINKVSVCTPNYDNWVSFTVDRWQYARSIVVNGHNNNPIPYWPDPDYNECTVIKYGCERQGGYSEKYVVTYERSKGDNFTCDTTSALYGEYRIGQKYELEDGLIVHIARCDTLEAQ